MDAEVKVTINNKGSLEILDVVKYSFEDSVLLEVDQKETATSQVTESNEKVITVSKGEVCRIDCGTYGMNVEGSAKIIVITD